MRPSVVVPFLLVSGLALASCGEPRESTPPPVPMRERMPAVDPARTIEGTLLVSGMTCSGCEYNVSSSLRLVPGVLEAEADHESGKARVRFDPEVATLTALAEAVRQTGYDVAPAGDSEGR